MPISCHFEIVKCFWWRFVEQLCAESGERRTQSCVITCCLITHTSSEVMCAHLERPAQEMNRWILQHFTVSSQHNNFSCLMKDVTTTLKQYFLAKYVKIALTIFGFSHLSCGFCHFFAAFLMLCLQYCYQCMSGFPSHHALFSAACASFFLLFVTLMQFA